MKIKTRKYYIAMTLYQLVFSLLIACLNPLFALLMSVYIGMISYNVHTTGSVIVLLCAILSYVVCYVLVIVRNDNNEYKIPFFEREILSNYRKCSRKYFTTEFVNLIRSQED